MPVKEESISEASMLVQTSIKRLLSSFSVE